MNIQFTEKQLALRDELRAYFSKLMTPELVDKAKALSPEIKQFLMHVALRHERRSDSPTLVQVRP